MRRETFGQKMQSRKFWVTAAGGAFAVVTYMQGRAEYTEYASLLGLVAVVCTYVLTEGRIDAHRESASAPGDDELAS